MPKRKQAGFLHRYCVPSSAKLHHYQRVHHSAQAKHTAPPIPKDIIFGGCYLLAGEGRGARKLSQGHPGLNTTPNDWQLAKRDAYRHLRQNAPIRLSGFTISSLVFKYCVPFCNSLRYDDHFWRMTAARGSAQLQSLRRQKALNINLWPGTKGLLSA